MPGRKPRRGTRRNQAEAEFFGSNGDWNETIKQLSGLCEATRRRQSLQDGRGRQGGDHGHEDEHRKKGRRENAEVEAYVQDHQLHEAAGVHENAQRGGFPAVRASYARGEKAAAELAQRCDQNDDDTNQPVDGFLQKADLGAHSSERKKYRQEKNDDDIFTFFAYIAGELRVMRNNRAEKECAEERVDSNTLGEQRRNQ